MDTLSYIYDFLHDPHRNRWKVPRVEHAIELAKKELSARADAFIALRNIKREKAKLIKMQVEDKTAHIQLVDGKDVYEVPDENLVTIKRKMKKKKILSSKIDNEFEVIGVPRPDTVILDGDILVLSGFFKDLLNIAQNED